MTINLLRGSVTSKKKPNVSILCDSIYCNCPNDSFNGSILAYGHGYHGYCLQRQQFKCLICLNYLHDDSNALIKNLTKNLGENEPNDDTEHCEWLR